MRGTLSLTVLLAVYINSPLVDSRGGSRGGGGSWRGGSGSGGRYTPSTPSRSSPTQSRPSTPNTGVNYNWNQHAKPNPTPTSGAQNYGWTQPKQAPTNTGGSLPSQQKNPPMPTSGTNYGWTQQKQAPTNTGGSLPSQQKSPPMPTSGTNYGWKPQPTNTQRQQAHTTPAPYGFRAPPAKNAPQMPVTQRPNSNAPKQKNTPSPSQAPNLNNGKKYEKGYSKGYDQGYQRGLQQGQAKVPPAYYPPQNHFGYPGGYTGSHAGLTYGGQSIYGSPHNYGYPVNSGYGYHTYGSGRGPGLGTGLAVGLVGGYLLNSALHSFSYSSMGHSHYPSNSWGYSGGGYGSDYRYTRVDNSVTNNYYFNQEPPIAANSSSSETNQWIHCIAYDPMTEMTLTNPNCSCTVTVEQDSSTNTSSAVHSCTSQWGTHTEKTPLSEVEVFELGQSANQTSNPEKVTDQGVAERRNEVYKKLEMLVDMGCFVC